MCGMNVSLLGQSLSPASRSAMTLGGKLATSCRAHHGTHGGHAEGVGCKVARQGAQCQGPCQLHVIPKALHVACGHAESG